MSQIDLAVFLVAGCVGAFWRNDVAWGIVGLWAVLRLLGVVV